MNFIEIFLLVPLIEAWNVPLIVPLNRSTVEGESEQGRLIVGVRDTCQVDQGSRESILIWRSSMIRNFYLGGVFGSVLEDIKV